MIDTSEKIISQTEKKISQKGNEEYMQRIIVRNRDGNTYKMISDIKRKKITKEIDPCIIERMKWKKFGVCAGQSRGSLEPGIIVTSSEEIHIINRETEIEHDIGDKIRDSINNRKMMVLKEMREARERENREKLDAYTANTKNLKTMKRRNKEGTIKITGFNPNYTEDKLAEIFKEIGPIRRCTMPSKNFAFIEFFQSIHAKDAFDKFNDEARDNCVLRIIIPDNK